MDEKELKRELTRYELNLPYPFSCLPEPQRKKFALIFMAINRAQKAHQSKAV